MDKKVNIIKNINLNKIREALKATGTATKPKLAELTGLSVVTVNSLVNTLIDLGEVFPDLILNSEGGRPAASFRYNSNYRLALMVYMHEQQGQDTAFYRVINLRQEVIARVEQRLSKVSVDSFDTEIEQLLKQYPQIQAICFGIPGAEVDERLIISDYEQMRDQSLSGHLREKFQRKVLIENDINAAVLGYCHQQQISEDQCIIGIYFPDKYPPGAGIYLKGDIFKGRDGLAGEIKYLPFEIHWEDFEYHPSELELLIIKTIQVFMSTHNPNRIILYGDTIPQDILEKLQMRCHAQVEQLMLPDIIRSKELNNDFEQGIKKLALRMIEEEAIHLSC